MENPTVAVLERLAHALDVEIIDFFVVPKAGAKPPQVLAKGRHPSRERTKSGINK
jgi:transcriptional regulator with XRE-family HTH domain